jgi:hypothetical protein
MTSRGSGKPRSDLPKWVVERVRKAGVTPEEMTDVILARLRSFRPLADRHDLSMDAVIKVHIAIASQASDMLRALDRIADAYGIPHDDLVELCKDVRDLIISESEQIKAKP